MNDEIKEILDFKENGDYKRISCDEIAILRDYITNLQHTEDLYNQCLKDYDELQARIEKAIEYLKEHSSNGVSFMEWFECIELLNILNGRSDE